MEMGDNIVMLRASENVTVPKNCIQWVTVTTGNETMEGPHVFSTSGKIEITVADRLFGLRGAPKMVQIIKKSENSVDEKTCLYYA